MLNKLLLNNQILANKKSVQKARVNLVNKLVQKLRKLKQMTDKYPENKKFKNKVMKATETLICVKKLKSTEVVKLALLNDKNPYVTITNGLSTPDEVAQALFFSHKIIIEIVDKLKKLLHLDETNTSWKEEVTELSKRKQKHLRTERKQKIRQERKARHELTKKRNEWLVENVPKAEKVQEEESETKQDEPIEAVTPTPKIRVKEVKVRKPKEKISRPQPEPSLQPEQESDEEEETSISNIRAVDPFFITETGTNYLSTAVIDRVQPDVPNDGLVRKDRRAAQNNRSYNRHGNGPNRQQPYAKTWEKTKPKTNSWQLNGTQKSKPPANNKPFGYKVDKPEQSAEKLHPSWAAKQKQKVIQTFRGTKVTFSDEPNPKSLNKSATVGSAVAEKLHPSWAAKQKLKPNITEFKGQKIVFGED